MIFYDAVTLAYDGTPVLEGFTLHIAPGAHIALMGPSGCGKSSALNLAAGLLAPSSGAVRVEAKRLAYVFQEPRLLPWLTAAENVNAVLSDRPETMPKALEWLAAAGLEGAAEKRPAELSGGMRQRVNLARALAYDGDALLLDEPLEGLDKPLQEEMLSLLRRCTEGKTLLLATHDPAQAQALDCRILKYQDKAFVSEE
ncbi:MAG: ATP-binding cassette domain-containing protein [Oscillospiraceae bacterium]|nr:ATP-binding cassette domain-containing protein [Oscillospiraceae bacterium]